MTDINLKNFHIFKINNIPKKCRFVNNINILTSNYLLYLNNQ